MDIHKDWYSSLSVEDLSVKYQGPNPDSVFEEDSPLQILASTKNGRTLLHQFLEKSPTLRDGILPQIWSYIYIKSTSKKSAKTFILESESKQLFQQLLPEIFKEASVEAKPLEEKKMLEVLCNSFINKPSEQGLEWLLRHKDASILFFHTGILHERQNTSLIHFVLDKHKDALLKLLNKDPSLLGKILTAENLCALTFERPALYWIIAATGSTLISKLDNTCLSQLTERAVFADYLLGPEKSPVITLLNNPIEPEVCEFLKRLCLHNKKIFNRIGKEVRALAPGQKYLATPSLGSTSASNSENKRPSQKSQLQSLFNAIKTKEKPADTSQPSKAL